MRCLVPQKVPTVEIWGRRGTVEPCVLWDPSGLQAHGFESCPRSECRLDFLTRGNGFLAASLHSAILWHNSMVILTPRVPQCQSRGQRLSWPIMAATQTLHHTRYLVLWLTNSEA
ncbi:hypothetical protein E2C01_021629 [Portunus trituberculatus]|uniref:Uncharacterized protein n=1 Tax=Portunus trituberculatus TaxID=210409 RepID=A0A5B7E6M4_PORTR|nr:hypothetical protein [Portunus trituberculatus]